MDECGNGDTDDKMADHDDRVMTRRARLIANSGDDGNEDASTTDDGDRPW